MTERWVAAVLVVLMVLMAPDSSQAFFGSGKKGILKKKERAAAVETLSAIEGKAQMVFFSTTGKCKRCGDIERLVEELSGLSEDVSHEVLDFESDALRAAGLGVERAPAIVLLDGDGRDYGIRYYGLPLGYEFEAFLEALRNTALGTPGLADETAAGLGLLKNPVTITVFVTRH